jgi:hypothetical protein
MFDLLARETPGRLVARRIPTAAATAIWLALVALLVAQGSNWVYPASMVAGWQIAKMWHRRLAPAGRNPAVPRLDMLVAAFCVQGGVVVAVLGRLAVSAALLGIGSALVAWASGNGIPRARRKLLNFVLAMAFTVTALMRGSRSVSGEMTRGAQPGAAHDEKPAARAAELLGGTYTGVILLTEPAPHTLLVPPLPSMTPSLFAQKRTEPLSIPFFGVYWMFRWPQRRPPQDAYTAYESPLTSVFRSSNRSPLSMEAHQNFGTLIDLRCCSKIQLALRSADQEATLDLVLTNTTVPGKPALSLGRETIPAAALPILATFPVPIHPTIQQFDEATIVFNRVYAIESARVAIDRFVFVPKGL